MARLSNKLQRRRQRIDLLESWYRGEPPIPFLMDGTWQEALRRFHQMGRTNFAELVVEAVRERMRPVGFRTGADGDSSSDDAAWDIWQANDMDIIQADVHRDMLALSVGYVVVGEDDDEQPLITHETPRQAIVELDPANQRKVLAGLKIYHDDVQARDFAYLYLPGQLWVSGRSRNARNGSADVTFSAQSWEIDDDLSAQLPVPDYMPIVEFRNKLGLAEYETHVDILHRINQTIVQRMWITTMQAFRQRGFKGLPEEDKDGNPIDYTGVFALDPGAMWQLPPEVDIWESQVTDITPILNAIKSDVTYLASVTRTPLHYLTPDAAAQSAEGASLQREGLVFKTQDRINRASPGWARVMQNALKVAKNPAAAQLNPGRVIWAPPERLTLAERGAAAVQATDVPWETKMTDIWQFSPETVERMKAQRADDQLLQDQVAAALATAAARIEVTPSRTQADPALKPEITSVGTPDARGLAAETGTTAPKPAATK